VNQSDSIELFNLTDTAIDVSGWFLSDSDNDLLKFQIPNDTVLEPGSYIVFDERDFNPNPTNPGSADFALNGAQGDDVWLVIPDGSGGVTSIVDDVHFGASRDGETMGRTPNGIGRLAPMSRNTLGCGNSYPRVGPLVISEISYNAGEPSSAALTISPNLERNELEFIEVHNPTIQSTKLTDWRLRGGVDYDFEASAELAAGETLIVISFNPASPANTDRQAAFRAHYGLDADVRIVGGWNGQLGDGGDAVRLERPDVPPPGDPAVTPHIVEDEVFYDDRAPWASVADGGGSSLQRAAPVFFGNDANGWFAAAATPGTVHFFGNVLGDLTGDQVVSANDINVLFDAVHADSTVSYLDLDGSNSVDEADVTFLVMSVLGTNFGDANLDGHVDGSDFNAWNQNRLQGCNKSWPDGDFTGDGVTDGSDFNLWYANRFAGNPAPAAAAQGQSTKPWASAHNGATLAAKAVFSTTSHANRDGRVHDAVYAKILGLEAPRAECALPRRLPLATDRGAINDAPSSGCHKAARESTDGRAMADPVDSLFGQLGNMPRRREPRQS
jgi:hypothetical protein